ncbi:MAG: UDP-N-acetylglucosamine 2-epimerase (non-hydrolyzing) [Deltaproteobacteria bacterium]|nr:UDP-N-acetylglucosamine 2-epimerase (non-hydrolyzing) [Deltaproteobacteria bacterium]
MKSHKVISIVGARPQFIKLAPVANALRTFNIPHKIIHTGQHYDYSMSDMHFGQLRLDRPDYNLGVGSASHARQTGEMLPLIEEVLQKENPALTLVYGDTNSTLAGALASVKIEIPVAHVEAGLRSFVEYMPEEINRRVTDHISKYLFCPTQRAMKLLQAEGLKGILTGDVMVDALMMFSKVKMDHPYKKPFILATIHRAENTDNKERFMGIWKGLNLIAKDISVIFPVHPRTKNFYKDILSDHEKGLSLADPVGYLEMIAMERDAQCIITDSGGVQKEALILETPCVTVRKATEWPETIELGGNCLVDARPSAIYQAVSNMAERSISEKVNPFGDGKAGYNIASFIKDHCV